jgi:hypothetical protein
MNQPTTAAVGRRQIMRAQRRAFFAQLGTGLRMVWPVVSGLILLIVLLGVITGLIEGWPLGNSLYFSFITGLTIGYGDLVPKLPITKGLAVLIGATGILLTALLAAVAVKALGTVDPPER